KAGLRSCTAPEAVSATETASTPLRARGSGAMERFHASVNAKCMRQATFPTSNSHFQTDAHTSNPKLALRARHDARERSTRTARTGSASVRSEVELPDRHCRVGVEIQVT